MFVIATLTGGTTIGGYPAIHTGMKQINLTGKISMVNPADDVFIEMQAFNNPASIVRFYSTEDGGGITSSGSIAFMAADGLSMQGVYRTSLHSNVEIDLNAPSVKVSGNLTWNNGVDSLDALKSSVSSGKTSIASAITAKGVAATGSDTHAQLATKIGSIQVGDYSIGDVIPSTGFTSLFKLNSTIAVKDLTLTVNPSGGAYLESERMTGSFFNESIMADVSVGSMSGVMKLINITTGALITTTDIGPNYWMSVRATKDYIYAYGSDYYLRVYNTSGGLMGTSQPHAYSSMGLGYFTEMAVDYYTNTAYFIFFKQINGNPDSSSVHFIKYLNYSYAGATNGYNLTTAIGASAPATGAAAFCVSNNTLIIIPFDYGINSTYKTIAFDQTFAYKWKTVESWSPSNYARALTDGTFLIKNGTHLKRYRESDYVITQSLTFTQALIDAGFPTGAGMAIWDGKYMLFIKSAYQNGDYRYPLYMYDPATALVASNITKRDKLSDLNEYFTKNICTVVDSDKAGTFDLKVIEIFSSSTGQVRYGKFKRATTTDAIILK